MNTAIVPEPDIVHVNPEESTPKLIKGESSTKGIPLNGDPFFMETFSPLEGFQKGPGKGGRVEGAHRRPGQGRNLHFFWWRAATSLKFFAMPRLHRG